MTSENVFSAAHVLAARIFCTRDGNLFEYSFPTFFYYRFPQVLPLTPFSVSLTGPPCPFPRARSRDVLVCTPRHHPTTSSSFSVIPPSFYVCEHQIWETGCASFSCPESRHLWFITLYWVPKSLRRTAHPSEFLAYWNHLALFTPMIQSFSVPVLITTVKKFVRSTQETLGDTCVPVSLKL